MGRDRKPRRGGEQAGAAGRGITKGLTDYGDREFSAYLRRSFASSMGYSREALGRRIVGIAHTPSGFNGCHRHFPEMLEAVKRGALMAGALPVEFPTISLGEVFLSPTSMKYRNLMSIDTEEMIRAQPMDSVVLMGGCDKTVPAQLMGAASADVPAVQLVAGPMSTSFHGKERLGACTDCRRFWARHRAGEIGGEEIARVEARLATTAGTCAVMGTASTMACVAESLGISLPGTSAIPAVHADRLRAAEASGAVAARLADRPIRPGELITPDSVENALRVTLAIGGSTNAVIHLTAIAGRLGIKVSLRRLNELSETTPVLVNLKPTGDRYMEDFFHAGGTAAVLRELRPLLNLGCPTVTGKTLGETLEEADAPPDREVIAPLGDPLERRGGLLALFGSLAPRGALVKRSAADRSLLEKTGRAVVFDSVGDLASRIDDPDLDVGPDDFLVLRNAGPASPQCMPEAGHLPIPRKLSSRGVRDMVRISDARMSGTAFGTVVLHVTPEAAVGGPLALVRTGDGIRISERDRSLDLLVDDNELGKRREALGRAPRAAGGMRGYNRLYAQEILQADEGCDFRFMLPGEGDGDGRG